MPAVEVPSLSPDPADASAASVPRCCLVCGSRRLHYLFSVGEARVVRCKDCGLMLGGPRTGAGSGTSLPTAETALIPPGMAAECLDLLCRYRGRADGRLLAVLPDGHGWPPGVAEPGPEVSAVNPAEAGALEHATAGGTFDVVALYHVIDAVADPQRLLRQVRALLAPDGVLYVAATVFDRWSALRFRRRWKELRSSQRCYFTRATLETLLIHGGFGKIITRGGASGLNGGGTQDTVLLARRQEKRVPPTLSVVMPVFNEARTFATNFEKVLAKEVAGLEIEIVVVESRSTDGTREIVARYQDHPRVTVVWEDRPRGKGRAVRSGLEQITGDYVLIQDADLEYDLEDYEALLEPLVQGHAAFVLGARHGGSAWKMRSFSGQPVVSAVLNLAHWFFTLLVNVGFGARMKDPFTMYKVFRRDCLYGLEFECNRFDFDFELVIKLLRKGYQPLEIPVNYRSRSFAEGKKVSFFGDPVTWLRALVKFRLEPMDVLVNVERQRRRAGGEF